MDKKTEGSLILGSMPPHQSAGPVLLNTEEGKEIHLNNILTRNGYLNTTFFHHTLCVIAGFGQWDSHLVVQIQNET